MNIALPVLLLIIGSLTFWLLTESSIKYYLKIASITIFCLFTIIFWSTIHTFLGWPALKSDMPEKVLIHWVIVKEPNNILALKGKIYFLIESPYKEKNFLLSFFGYKNNTPEPRLFGLPYSRSLHEQIEKEMRNKLLKGQPVVGQFSEKNGGKGKGRSQKGSPKDDNQKGGGSESQEQEWEFHVLRPSEYQPKE